MDKFKRILQFCGACIAFYIGAGFATMQEVMQYEASYGSEFWVVIAVCAVIYVYTNLSFISNACPLLWTGIRVISTDGTKLYKILIIVGGIVGCMIACFVPYRPLLNVIYGLNGYLGFILIAFMIVNDLRLWLNRKK